MIKINNMENWYGISKLNNPDRIKGNTIIYSPNGVMKTSFSDGFRDLNINVNPMDVFNELDSKYEIENNGNKINQLTEAKNIDVLVFSGSQLSNEYFEDVDVSNLLISDELKIEYYTELNNATDIIKKVKEILSRKIGNDNKYNEKTVKLLLGGTPGINEIDYLINFIDSIGTEIFEVDTSNIKISTIFDSKINDIINGDKFTKSYLNYMKILSKEIDETIFKKDFGLNELILVNDTLLKYSFFDAGHTINLSGQEYGAEQLQKFIDETKTGIYGSEAVKKAFDDMRKVVNKASNRGFMKIIEDNNWILPFLDDFNLFKKKLLSTRAVEVLEELNEYVKDLKKIRHKTKQIMEKASQESTRWRKVIEIFNDRFTNKHYNIIIENYDESILGISVPRIKRVLNNNGMDIDSKILKRFSSGEKRIIFILEFLFKIELAKTIGNDFCVILDDIVESFDYKNKYSIIEYLKELSVSVNPSIQLIILTHNFDFYRSCRISMKPHLESKLIAYEKNKAIELIEAKSEEYINFSFIKDWRHQNSAKSRIALLPFIRNIYEIKNGSSSDKYARICDFLHYNEKTANCKISDLTDIFDEFGFDASPEDIDVNYFGFLKQKVSEIIKNGINEKNIMDKIILGIFIRLSTDFFLLNRYKTVFGKEPKLNKKNWTSNLYNEVKEKLIQEEIKLYNTSIIIAPSFIHVNSFMFEPLIDVGPEKITEIATHLLKYIEQLIEKVVI